ncbi:MAG: AIM24 family protein [Clostridiales bacterium]
MFNPDFLNAVKVIDTSTSKNGSIYEVIEYIKPRANSNYSNSGTLSSLQYQKLRQIRININNSSIITQPGALQFMKGPITMELKSNSPNAVKGFFKSVGTGESSITPKYSGKYGEIYLEPSFKYYYVIEMENEQIILDDGMFYCCDESIQLDVYTNTAVTGLFGGDGFKQPLLKGSGVAVLESNVPFEEVLIYQLNNETIKIDGKFAIVVRGDINIKMEKSTNSVLGSIKSGEGILQTYTGTGEIWVAPGKLLKPLEI